MPKAKTTPKKASKQPKSLARILPWILVVGGLIGLVCSLILAYDQMQIWQNPSYQPACSLNPVISCGNVINSGEGKLLGVPGPLYGLLVFPVLITIGMALFAGAQFKRWFWIGLQLGATGGFAFALWMFLVSTYVVNSLCPFCLTVDVAVYTMFWYITLYNFERGHIKVSKRLQKIPTVMRRFHVDWLILWFIIMIVLALKHFWYYYGTHLF